MFRVKKQKNYYTFALRLFRDGIKKVKSVLLEIHPEEEDTILRIYRTLMVTLLLFRLKKKSVTVEYRQQNKKTTLSDKKIFLHPNSLITLWLQMSVRGLIGREKVLKPFWTKQCEDISQKLWLPIETDSVDSRSNFWSGSSSDVESNSWFSMKKKINPATKNSQTIFSPSYMFIPAETWEEEGIRTRKIRMYPTPSQKQTIKQWMGTRRFVYNKVLEKIKSKEEEKINFYDLRDKYVTEKIYEKPKKKKINKKVKKKTEEKVKKKKKFIGKNPNIEEWQYDIPKDIRASAIKDLVSNYKSAFSALKNGEINHFSMRYASKKDSPSISIPKTAIKVKDDGVFIYKSFLKEKIKIKETISSVIDCDCRLYVKNSEWFLCIPITTKIEQINNRHEWCSLDPGVRSFQTIYSEEMVLQIKVDKEKIKKLQLTIDKFRSLRDKKIIKKQRARRRERKIYSRMDNLIDDLHHKTIHYLTSTFNHIIIPIFETQEMAKRNSIKGIRGINRNLLQLKHYLFRERLKSKCLMRKCTLDVCTEEFTTQTCGVCGTLNKNVGGADVFYCNVCDINIDRDVNGSRNIGIKVINEH